MSTTEANAAASADLAAQTADFGARVRAAAAEVAFAPAVANRRALEAAADAVEARRDAIVAANARDMALARDSGLSPAMLDRLSLDVGCIAAIAARPARGRRAK